MRVGLFQLVLRLFSVMASESEIFIRDDTLNFVLQYFQTMNAHNYIQLPRNWWL